MASSQDPMSVATKVEPPLESMSRSFIDVKPGIIKYDVKHTHVVTIGNIRKKMEVEPGMTLQSEAFSISIGDMIIELFICIFPNGYFDGRRILDGSVGHIGVGIGKITNTEFPIHADMIFSLVDKDGSKVKSKAIFRILTNSGHCFGKGKFISHPELRENPDLIPNDTLTIMCEITIKGRGVSLVRSESRSSMLVPHNIDKESTRNYMRKMKKIFHDGKFADATIVCQGKEFPCHKAILAGRSSVFEAMFSPNFKEGMENKVEVEDVAADVIEDMLIFIYGGEVGDLQGRASELLVAAEKYHLEDLKKFCEESLCVNITVENVLDMMELADLHNAANLRSMALKFIGRNAKEVAAQKDWRERFPDVVVDIIDAIIRKGD